MHENIFSDFKEIENIVNNVQKNLKEWMQNHLKDIPHNKIRKNFEIDQLSQIVNIFTKKWSIEILWELEIHNGLNFNELNRNLINCSASSLSRTLKELQKYNLISRKIENYRPPRVLYALSEKGKGFVELTVLLLWFLQKH